MKYSLSILFLLFTFSVSAQISSEMQIKIAVQAAPENQRSGAKVWGYDNDGKFVVLRKGSNQMVCIGDDPNREGISVSCYHKDLEPFMQRGRDLKSDGKGRQEIFDIREKEVKAGKLKMPEKVTLHVLSGAEAEYDAENDIITNASLRWVIYLPYATPESTGLPLAPPFPGAPWLMDPGTHRAHIMITPSSN